MREIGPVRFLLGQSAAEVEAAKPYIGIARTQLGVTKKLMNLGGLQQLTRPITLQDGTVIICQSVMGQDIVSITPANLSRRSDRPLQPEAADTKRRTKLRKLSSTKYAWFRLPDGPAKNGHQTVWDYVNKRMLVWGGYDRPGMDIPAMPLVLDDDSDIIWEARSGGTLRYAQIADNHFSTEVGGVLTSFYRGAYWLTAYNGTFGPSGSVGAIGEGPRTGSDLVDQLYIGGTWQDKADAVRYDMPRGAFSSAMIDMLPSTALWKFEFTAGVPWSADPKGATDGVWTRLSNISYDDWAVIVAAVGTVDVSLTNLWAPAKGDALNHVTFVSGEFYDEVASHYYTGFTSADYLELYFGGTKDGSDTNASRQLWMYGPVVSVKYVEEDDPT